jgi:hypothetical protein
MFSISLLRQTEKLLVFLIVHDVSAVNKHSIADGFSVDILSSEFSFLSSLSFCDGRVIFFRSWGSRKNLSNEWVARHNVVSES